jgi:hypothetical protein
MASSAPGRDMPYDAEVHLVTVFDTTGTKSADAILQVADEVGAVLDLDRQHRLNVR